MILGHYNPHALALAAGLMGCDRPCCGAIALVLGTKAQTEQRPLPDRDKNSNLQDRFRFDYAIIPGGDGEITRAFYEAVLGGNEGDCHSRNTAVTNGNHLPHKVERFLGRR